VLTEQVEQVVRTWLAALGLVEDDAPAVHVVMGGREDTKAGVWRQHPHRDAIVIGTVDMLLSRALNRGYTMGRFSWPIDFGLFHNGCHWVYDEIQLLGPALPTSRQLDGLRGLLGTWLPTGSTWMSATVDHEGLQTIDRPAVGEVSELSPADRSSGLARRLTATRRVEQVVASKPSEVGAALVAAHRVGTLTVAIVNTVRSARDLYREVVRRSGDVPVTLLHSRFRPDDRQSATDAALAPVGPTGRIVVSTQVLEAGVDISATTMLIEAAPWPSVVQRAGRLNRDGLATGARLLWVRPERPAPYRPDDIDAAATALDALEGAEVTATDLGRRQVTRHRPVQPVLRRSDLVGLFDTTPDLSGNDIDVARYIRPREDGADVLVAWRDIGIDPPGPDDPKP